MKYTGGGRWEFESGDILGEISTAMSAVEATGHAAALVYIGRQEMPRLRRDGIRTGSRAIFDPAPAGWTVWGVPVLCVDVPSILQVVTD